MNTNECSCITNMNEGSLYRSNPSYHRMQGYRTVKLVVSCAYPGNYFLFPNVNTSFLMPFCNKSVKVRADGYGHYYSIRLTFNYYYVKFWIAWPQIVIRRSVQQNSLVAFMKWLSAVTTLKRTPVLNTSVLQ